jgi:hypothetical protein
MAQWRKVVVSGSNAALNQITASGAIVPKSDNSVDLGTSSLEFKDLYIDGTANLDTANISAGTITGITDIVVADGGTGASTFTDGGVLLGSGTDPITATAVLTNGQLLIGDNSGDPTVATLTGTANEVGITNGAGSITIGLTDDVTIPASLTVTTDLTVSGGDIILTGAATDIDLIDNNSSALSFDASGKAGILEIDSSNAKERVTMSGGLLVTGAVTASAAFSGSTGINAASLLLDTQLAVAEGGTGVTSLTDKAVLISQDSGTDAIGALAMTGNGEIIVGGTNGPAVEAAADVAGDGLSASAGDGTLAINLDIDSLSAEVIATGDTIAFNDDGDDGIHKESVDDLFKIGPALVTEAAIANGDYITFLDGGSTGEAKKEALADLATLFSGDGLQAASSVMAVDVSDFAGTGLEDDGSENLRLASQGTGIAGGGGSTLSVAAAQTTITSIINSSLGKIGTDAAQEYITFGTSNEVNTFINNSEVLSVTAAGVDVTGAVTISGNLDVNGTLTSIDSANTTIKDKFMIVASGSTSDTDGGIIVQNSSTAGYALGYDSGVDRWVLDADLAHTATNIGPDAYMGTVQVGTGIGSGVSAPTYGGSTNGVGTIYIDTDDGEIWIYA